MTDKSSYYQETDDFFEAAAKVFKQIAEIGLAGFDITQAPFQYESVRKCFAACSVHLKSSLFPDVLAAVTEWEITLAINGNRLTDQETLQLLLLKKIFQYYQDRDIEAFLNMCNQLCSHHCYNRCELLLGYEE